MTVSDRIVWLEGDDQEMLVAIQEAQSRFPEFVQEIERETHRIVPALDAAVVKAFFPLSGDPAKGEHMFVDNIEVDGDEVRGILASTPMYVTDLVEGLAVSFPISRISDWFYVINGKGYGGFTLNVLTRRMSAADLAEAKQHPPIMWFA